MNGRKAKAIRRNVYGDLSPRVRTYYRRARKVGKDLVYFGPITADERRRLYQREKRRA